MKRILLTGGTGHLGRELIPRLEAAGFTVRIMSRRSSDPSQALGPSPGLGAEWAQANLANGQGLAEAVDGVQIVIHAASHALKRQVDVDGTGRLLEEARKASVEQFVYISIAGIEQIDFAYYQNKLAAERLIEASGLPYTILRATQFHSFVDRILRTLTRLPVAFIPTHWQFQTISDADVADHLLAAVQRGPSGRLPDIGGPEVLRLEEMARQWLAARRMRRPIVHLPVPGGLSAGFRRGQNTTPQNRAGKITWGQWLEKHYATKLEGGAVASPNKAKEGGLSA